MAYIRVLRNYILTPWYMLALEAPINNGGGCTHCNHVHVGVQVCGFVGAD